jgi:hypothetical protein
VGSYTSEALVPAGSTQPPSELLNFIEKQESYIEQLEKESNFCRVRSALIDFDISFVIVIVTVAG